MVIWRKISPLYTNAELQALKLLHMELNPKIKELADLLHAEHAADKIKSDLANSDAFKNGTNVPIPEKLKDKQNYIPAVPDKVAEPSPLLAELAKQTKETREFGKLGPI